MESISLGSEPCEGTYASLLESAQAACAMFYIVTLDDQRYEETAQQVRSALRPFLQSSSRVTEWPGTQLLGSRGALREFYRLETGSAEVLRDAATCLYDWKSPRLPEDLGFVREDGTLWFASVAHEGDAWWELRADEFSQLCVQWPDLAALLDVK